MSVVSLSSSPQNQVANSSPQAAPTNRTELPLEMLVNIHKYLEPNYRNPCLLGAACWEKMEKIYWQPFQEFITELSNRVGKGEEGEPANQKIADLVEKLGVINANKKGSFISKEAAFFETLLKLDPRSFHGLREMFGRDQPFLKAAAHYRNMGNDPATYLQDFRQWAKKGSFLLARKVFETLQENQAQFIDTFITALVGERDIEGAKLVGRSFYPEKPYEVVRIVAIQCIQAGIPEKLLDLAQELIQKGDMDSFEKLRTLSFKYACFDQALQMAELIENRQERDCYLCEIVAELYSRKQETRAKAVLSQISEISEELVKQLHYCAHSNTSTLCLLAIGDLYIEQGKSREAVELIKGMIKTYESPASCSSYPCLYYSYYERFGDLFIKSAHFAEAREIALAIPDGVVRNQVLEKIKKAETQR